MPDSCMLFAIMHKLGEEEPSNTTDGLVFCSPQPTAHSPARSPTTHRLRAGHRAAPAKCQDVSTMSKAMKNQKEPSTHHKKHSEDLGTAAPITIAGSLPC